MSSRIRVLLGVTGGIAAYKTPELVRRLRDGGCEVRCALTRAAEAFVSPLALEVVTGHPVWRQEYLSANDSGEELHMTAARWPDVLLVAPATAHMLGRMALGLADDFLSTVALAYTGPVIAAPAMHSSMWSHAAVEQNVERLRARGVRLVGPEAGPLASGELGMGRMSEPDAILAAVRQAVDDRLAGLKVVVAAGPTREPIDAVRYLSNRSSGRMGFSIAAEAARRGAATVLVAGPVALETPHGDIERQDVTTAVEMAERVFAEAEDADIVVMAAAVADYRPAEAHPGKLKKSEGRPDFDLVENPDILAGLAERAPRAFRVGFAAEAGGVEAEGQRKLESKGAHLLVANDISRPDIGFDVDDNEVTVFRSGEAPRRWEKASKEAVAVRLWDLVAECLEGHRGASRAG